MIHFSHRHGAVLMRPALLLCLLLPVAACVSESNAGGGVQAAREAGAPQPAHAVYDCGPRGELTIDNFRSSVRLVDPEGDDVELPAAPVTQRSRYGQTPYALVLDGNEALYMKSGREPVNCRR